MVSAADVSSGARKWSLVFVGIGVGAIVAALFQVRRCVPEGWRGTGAGGMGISPSRHQPK